MMYELGTPSMSSLVLRGTPSRGKCGEEGGGRGRRANWVGGRREEGGREGVQEGGRREEERKGTDRKEGELNTASNKAAWRQCQQATVLCT